MYLYYKYIILHKTVVEIRFILLLLHITLNIDNYITYLIMVSSFYCNTFEHIYIFHLTIIIIVIICFSSAPLMDLFILYSGLILHLLILKVQGVQTKLSLIYFFTKNNIKCTFLNFLLKNQKQVIDIHVGQLFIQ